MTHLYDKAEEFINDIYWGSTHDKSNSLNIPDVIAERLIKDNKEKDPEYYDHRPGVIHVSSLSKCLRGVVLEMLGAKKDSEPDARKLGVFKAGNLFEDYIVEALGDKMLDRQTEYVYSYGGVIITGRDDGTIEHEGTRRMLECKSVHSDSFWYRQKEGTLVAYQNQMQIQTYLWFRRILPNVFIRKHTERDNYNPMVDDEIIYTNLDKQALWEHRGMNPDDVLTPVEKPDNSELNGIFAYVSKDDVTVAQAPVKFNQRIIDEVVLPSIHWVIEGYTKKDARLVPVPPLVRFQKSKGRYEKNWLCTYCDFHCQCAGAGWVPEAMAEVARLNKEIQDTMVNPHAEKKEAPKITATPVQPTKLEEARTERIKENNQLADAELGIEKKVEEAPPASPPPEGETTLERMMREQREKSGL